MLGKGVHISVQYLHLVKIDTLFTQPVMSCGSDGIMAGQRRGAADNATMTWGWLGLCLQHLSQNIKPIPIWLYFSEEYTIISIWYWYTYTCSYDLGYEQCYMKKSLQAWSWLQWLYSDSRRILPCWIITCLRLKIYIWIWFNIIKFTWTFNGIAFKGHVSWNNAYSARVVLFKIILYCQQDRHIIIGQRAWYELNEICINSDIRISNTRIALLA